MNGLLIALSECCVVFITKTKNVKDTDGARVTTTLRSEKLVANVVLNKLFITFLFSDNGFDFQFLKDVG